MDKELIDHIKHSLQAHEETYTPGAWDRFSAPEEKKKRGFAYWPLWSAAAIILVAGSIFLLKNPNSINADHIVKTSKSLPKKQESSKNEDPAQSVVVAGESKISASAHNDVSTTQRKSDDKVRGESFVEAKLLAVTSNNLFDTKQGKIPGSSTENYLANQSNLAGTIYSEKIISNATLNQAQIKLEKRKNTQGKITFEQLLEQDSRKTSLAKTGKSDAITKWEPGVFVAPSMGNDNKVNMNYGFSISYNLADKLSISSGIAYAALSTTSNPSASNENLNDAVANTPLSAKAVAYASASKSLESINANVRGINIPLEIKYNISSKFYTGIGVSALAVTNNKQDNNYLVSSAQNTAVANTFGITEQKMLIVTERVSEVKNESTATDKLLGFYNFSLGYKQKISKKNNFAVEPFLRIPMKTFSTDNLNLTNGGVRLKFDF